MPGKHARTVETDVPFSVWTTQQAGSRTQRKGRYLPASTARSSEMPPTIAAHAIEHYTSPGDLVIDPMCGIGTTLVEAVYLDRLAIGMEHEKRWADLALENITHATASGAPGYAAVVHGDGRGIDKLLGRENTGRATLILTSPSHEASTHGQVCTSPGRDDPAHRSITELFHDFAEILRDCRTLLKPGGFLVIATRPIRSKGLMIDIPNLVLTAAMEAGFENYERCTALLAGVSGDRLVPQPSFFTGLNAHTANADGDPMLHEDVCVLRRSPKSAQDKLKDAVSDNADDESIGCGCVPLSSAESAERGA